jgi:hypothetical protein
MSAYEWNPPMTRTEAFADLVDGGMSADKAFTILALIAADSPTSPIDASHMADIRELAEAYVKHAGMEAEFAWLGKTEGRKGSDK